MDRDYLYGAPSALISPCHNLCAVCVCLTGPCSFSMSSDFRVSGLPQAAASYIIAPHGPTLTGQGKYELPPGEAVSQPSKLLAADCASELLQGL